MNSLFRMGYDHYGLKTLAIKNSFELSSLSSKDTTKMSRRVTGTYGFKAIVKICMYLDHYYCTLYKNNKIVLVNFKFPRCCSITSESHLLIQERRVFSERASQIDVQWRTDSSCKKDQR